MAQLDTVTPGNEQQIIIHFNENNADKKFSFYVPNSVAKLNHLIYDNLINSVASHFNLPENNFNIYEDIMGKHNDIGDWDDLAGSLEHVNDALHLYVEMVSNPTDYINDVYEEKQDEKLEPDELYKWCEKNGFKRCYESLIDIFGFSSFDDLIQCDLEDLQGVCDELKLTEKEKRLFLNGIIFQKESNGDSNELKEFCNKHNLNQIYDILIKSGYYSISQISNLSKDEQKRLCKDLGIKYGIKTRFLKNLPKPESKHDNDICENAQKNRKIIKLQLEQKQEQKNDITDEYEIKCFYAYMPASDDVKNDNIHSIHQHDNDIKNNRTILFVGETGTGKTATINSLINYLYDVEFYGDRYELITENFNKKSTESQTSNISVYYLTPKSVDFALTIVDTPGFGNCDKNGIQFDQVITKQLKHLFKSIVTEIDGICFLVKSSDNKLTDKQQYVFREIINVFGNNVKDNIILLFTFDDGLYYPPLGLNAVNDNNPPIPHRDKYFAFNNAIFNFHINLNQQNQNVFNKNMEIFADFFEEISKTKTQSLQLAAQVLEQRHLLKGVIQSVAEKLREGLMIYRSIEKAIKQIEDNKDEINKNADKLITIHTPEYKKVLVRKTKRWFEYDDKKFNQEMNRQIENVGFESNDHLQSFWVCQNCKLTCSKRFPIQRYNYIFFTLTNDYVCDNCKCSSKDSKHIVYVKYKYDLVLKEKQVPVRLLDCGYLDASLYESTSDMLIKSQTKKLKEAQFHLCELAVKINKCINEIKKLALNTNFLRTHQYFDLLIQNEKSTQTDGWQDRVNALKSLQKQQELIVKIEQNYDSEKIEAIFPDFFDNIQSALNFEQKQEDERMVKMCQKNYIDQERENQRKKKQQTGWFHWVTNGFATPKEWTYQTILENFRGHIIKTDKINLDDIITSKKAKYCCSIIDTCYKGKIYVDHNTITDEKGRWMILLPKTSNTKSRHGAYIAFRETTLSLNLIKNVVAKPTNIEDEKLQSDTNECTNNQKKAPEIMVHGRLYKILMTYFDNIVEKLKELKIGTKGSNIRNLYMTGSSLGGGLAILFAFEMIRRGYINEESMKFCKCNVITFGAPTVLASDASISDIMHSNKPLQLLNQISHCYVNRLDPMPRLIHLFGSCPGKMTQILNKTLRKNNSRSLDLSMDIRNAVVNEFFGYPGNNMLGNVFDDFVKRKCMYFAIGRQYIFCGQHPKWYCGEQLKIRTEFDVVTSFAELITGNISQNIWDKMFEDHTIENYRLRLQGKCTLI